MGFFGWLGDKIRGVFKWIGDKIIKPVAAFIRRCIEDIKVQIRIMRHEINNLLAKWLESDLGFLTFIATIAIVVIYLPSWVARLQGVKLWIFLESMAIKIKEGLLRIIDVERIIDLKLLHTVLKVFWPAYREAMKDFSDAVSQLASELGEGSAYIHAYLASARMLHMGSAAILGAPMETAEASWYADSTEYLEYVNSHFTKYAKDPGLIYYDYVDWYLRDAYGTYRDLNQAELDQIRENYERTREVEKGIVLLETGIETLADNLPNVIEEQFRLRWDPAKEYLDELMAIWRTVIQPMIEEIVLAIEERAKYQAAINEKVLARFNDPNLILNGYIFYEDSERAEMEATIEFILTNAIAEDIMVQGQTVAEWTDRLHAIEMDYTKEILAITALTYEPVTAGVFRPDIKLDIPSPFVGDY